jgi:hypothetical protein
MKTTNYELFIHSVSITKKFFDVDSNFEQKTPKNKKFLTKNLIIQHNRGLNINTIKKNKNATKKVQRRRPDSLPPPSLLDGWTTKLFKIS